MLDKSERLIHITEYLADEVEKGNSGIIVDREALKQAAEYCKADLESAVVGEKEFAQLAGRDGISLCAGGEVARYHRAGDSRALQPALPVTHLPPPPRAGS